MHKDSNGFFLVIPQNIVSVYEINKNDFFACDCFIDKKDTIIQYVNTNNLNKLKNNIDIILDDKFFDYHIIFAKHKDYKRFIKVRKSRYNYKTDSNTFILTVPSKIVKKFNFNKDTEFMVFDFVFDSDIIVIQYVVF